MLDNNLEQLGKLYLTKLLLMPVWKHLSITIEMGQVENEEIIFIFTRKKIILHIPMIELFAIGTKSIYDCFRRLEINE